MPKVTAWTAALVVSALLLTGCSGGDDEPEAAPSADVSASAAPAAPGATLVETGLTQLAQGDDAAARTTFENALSLEPDNLFAHYNLGLIAQRAGDTAGAVEQYDAALAIDDAYAPALFNRGILTEATDLDEAVALYRRAVAADDTFAAAFMRLGFALVHQGDLEGGQSALGRGVSLDPSMADVEAPSYVS